MEEKSKIDTILVTGGAGFVGSHLCEELIAGGSNVVCVDNFLTGNRRNVEKLMGNDKFELIEADVSVPVKEYLRDRSDVSQIFHLASPASPIGYQDNPFETYKVNSFGTHYLCDYADKVGAVMMFASTSEAYGDPLEHPQKESYWGNVHIRGVRACYDVSKRYGEMVQTVWRREKGLKIRTVRIFNTYGPRMDPNDGRVFPNFISQALRGEFITVHGDGSQTRSYCYVDDLVRGILMMMENEKCEGKVYNLGNPDEYTVLEMAEKIKSLTGSDSEIVFKEKRDDDPSRRRPDISLVSRELGWSPSVGVEEGLKKTIEYFKGVV